MVSEVDREPKRLGDFEIVRELGRGGMGIVYEARQCSLNRRVALKIHSSGLGLTAKAVVRFRREAEAAAKLHHTNIVPIYATGEEHGVYYYAMELVEGPSLDQVIRQLRMEGESSTEMGESSSTDNSTSTAVPAWVLETLAYEAPKPTRGSTTSAAGSSHNSDSSLGKGNKYFDVAAGMIADVAEALEHAHEHGVIHRDVKPSNLLLARDGRLSINDFGLARVLEQPGMTMSGEFVGSPLYMSPEQITAGRAPLDHRTDVYSLGATLYEMLTLQPPFPGKTRDEVIAQILHKEPRAPRKLNRRIPLDLETICLKAIAGDPDRRYQSAGAFAKDLRNYVNRFAISAKRTGPLGRAIKYARRNPVAASLAALLLLVLFAGAFLVFERRNREQQNELARIQDRTVEAILKGEFAFARECQEKAREYDVDPYWYQFTDGQIELYKGDYAEAIERLDAALKSKPDSIPAKSLLAVANLWGGNESAYYAGLRTIKDVDATDFDDFLYLGFANVMKNPEVSVRLFDKAEAQSPSHNIVRLYRAQAKRFCAMMIGNDSNRALTLALDAVADAETSTRVLKHSPVAAAEFALGNLVAGNIYRDLSDRDAEDREQYLANAEKHVNLAKQQSDELKNYAKSFDATYARFLILSETDDESRLREPRLAQMAAEERKQRRATFCRARVIVPQQSAQPLATFDLTRGTTYFLTRDDDPIAQRTWGQSSTYCPYRMTLNVPTESNAGGGFFRILPFQQCMAVSLASPNGSRPGGRAEPNRELLP